MSQRLFDPPVRVRAVLSDDDEDLTAEAIARAIGDDGVAHSALRASRHLSRATLGTVDREVGAVAEQLLDLDVGDVLVKAWRTYTSLVESARRTLASPGSEEVVPLTSHRITSEYGPTIDLFVDRLLVHTFELRLQLTFELTALDAVVTGGDLIRLRGGGGPVKATLSLDAVPVTEGRRRIPPWADLWLTPPVRLVRPSPPGQRPG